jgi:hypothetical protein
LLNKLSELLSTALGCALLELQVFLLLLSPSCRVGKERGGRVGWPVAQAGRNQGRYVAGESKTYGGPLVTTDLCHFNGVLVEFFSGPRTHAR